MAQKISPMTGATTQTPTLETPAAPATRGTTAHKPHRTRRTLKQRFEAANASHDGKLTPEQVKAAKWTGISRHFDAIDTAHHGYVTIDDIHAYNRAQRAAHRNAKKAKAAKPAAAPTTTE